MRQSHNLTINAPLILKMREIIFILRANYIMGHFKGYFEGAKIFWTPELSRAQRGTRLPTRSSAPVSIFLQELCVAPTEEDGAIGRIMSLSCVACNLPARSSGVSECVTLCTRGLNITR